MVDWLGTEITFYDETETEVTVRVTVHYQAMHCWALQYCNHVKILIPVGLADRVREDLRAALHKYEED